MTTDPVEVLDVIVQDVIVGSVYHLDTNRWEFLGPWDDRHRMRMDSEEDFTTRIAAGPTLTCCRLPSNWKPS